MSDFMASAQDALQTKQPKLQVVIHNKEQDKYYMPAVLEGLTWETAWKGQPGTLSFQVVKDEALTFAEGDTVQANYDGTNFFYGFIFTKRRNKDGVIKVTAYDQIRYLKNKDTYNFTNLEAGEEIRRIAEDFKLKTGTLVETGYTIPKFRGANKTLLDIMQALIDMTTENTGKLYVLYDDFGELTLKLLDDMELDLLIDNETAEDFTYVSSIDRDVYNRVKLFYDNKETGKRDVWISQDSANIARWGMLQLTESINPDKPLNFEQMADIKLKLKNRVKRTLRITKAFGDLRVRGGSLLYVNLKFDDMTLTKKVIVDRVTHHIDNGLHTMDLDVRGDVITG